MSLRVAALYHTLLFFAAVSVKADPPLEERIPFTIQLLKLSAMKNNTAIRISESDNDDYAIVAEGNDLFVKNGRNKVKKTEYRESPLKSYYLTDFEASQLKEVTESFIETLEDFEKNLQHRNWGKCLYLDGFLPKFIRNYYILLGVSRNDTRKYKKKARIFESEYEVSLRSPLSDKRIRYWRSDADRTIKLRIATKELIRQLKLWVKRELNNRNRNPEISLSLKCEESLDLFVRVYFSLKAPSPYHQTTERAR
jgi:hypothetical protein